MISPGTPDELRLESDRRLALATVAIILCINLAFVIFNLKVAGAPLAEIPPIVKVRLFGVLVAAFLTVALNAAQTQAALEQVVFAGAIVTVAITLGIQALCPPGDVPAISFDLVLVGALFIAIPGRPSRQVIPAALLSIGAATELYVPGSAVRDADKLQYLMFFATALGLGFVASVRRHELRSDLVSARGAEWKAAVEAERAKRELQTLRGIIPICSHCHRVRIEDGRLWEGVDMYVSRMTDAAFSHGVCPDCLVEHYPNVRMDSVL